MRGKDQKPYKGAGMEGWVARWYTRTRRHDMADYRGQAESIAGHLPKGCELLEVAPGPGFFAIELLKLGDFKITGLDISRTLVEIARENARSAGAKVDFRLGNASAIAIRRAVVRFCLLRGGVQEFFRTPQGAGRDASRS